MAAEKCIMNPEIECQGLLKAGQLEKDIMDLKEDLKELNRQNSDAHQKIFDRINQVETGEKVHNEQYKHIQEKMDENRDSIAEIKADSKTMMNQLNDISSKMSGVDKLNAVVDELKSKPARRWEELIKQVIGLVVGAVIAVVFMKIGLSA